MEGKHHSTYLVVRNSGHTIARYTAPFPVRSHPELRVHLVLRDELACEDVARQQVVVHGLRDDFRDRRGVELDERVVFRFPRLSVDLVHVSLVDDRSMAYLLVARET